jgi:hypothetical protein
MATKTFQVPHTSLFEMNHNLSQKQVNETVWKKTINPTLMNTIRVNQKDLLLGH